jgi:ABC-2 type transport system permease protein
MRREGSPFQGLSTVVLKELSDNLSSIRMRVLEVLVVLVSAVMVYFVVEQLRLTTAEDRFILLKVFTVSKDPLPSFVGILGFLVPILAIGLGFDAINGEHSRRTLSRILAQPLYRDALLAGKFLAGMATLAIALLSMWLLLVGWCMIRLGLPPGGEEIARSLVFLVITLAYTGVWLALAILLSVVFRSAATAALVALGIWLFLTLIWPMLTPALAQVISPPDIRSQLMGIPSVGTVEAQLALARLSPNTLFGESVIAILSPSTRSLGPIFLDQLQGAVIGAALPLRQSLLLAWPQLAGLVAGMIVLFVASYVVFQRQEVRA